MGQIQCLGLFSDYSNMHAIHQVKIGIYKLVSFSDHMG